MAREPRDTAPTAVSFVRAEFVSASRRRAHDIAHQLRRTNPQAADRYLERADQHIRAEADARFGEAF